MYGITDLKKDTLIELNNKPYKITNYTHTSMGRGGAVVRVKLKNLLDNTTLEHAFKNDEKIKPASIDKKKVQYLFADSNNITVMDLDNFDQTEIKKNLAESVVKYTPEGMILQALMYKDKIIGFDTAKNVNLKVVQTGEGAKGNTATSASKPAKLETGIEIQVPLFIKQGDKVKVDTRSGQYLERAK